MNIWLVIFLGGVGTYFLRSLGVWLPSKVFPARWLVHLPLAVILVMSVSSIYGLMETRSTAIAAIAATLAVIFASFKKLPLVVCIAIGCVAFGVLA